MSERTSRQNPLKLTASERIGLSTLALAGVILAGQGLRAVVDHTEHYVSHQVDKARKLDGPTKSATPQDIASLPFINQPHKEIIVHKGEGASQIAQDAFPEDQGNQQKFQEDISMIAHQGVGKEGQLEAGQAVELPERSLVGDQVDPS